ncbi:DnaD domain-containing protein [Sporosarcina sp. FSL W7-1283]|uniref:DnaD domain-containing protein n=1 Tax=Sporosarcina sp. FSL W7-1283 TaxID=2921560 RepID=UPI0030F64549
MSTYQEVRHILSQVSGHDRIVTIPKLYIELTGSLPEAILLNQIVFYSDKSSRKDGFFYKKYEEWAEEICLTERQVRHATKKLKEKQLIETKLLKANGAPTVHYKLLFDNLVKWILTKGKNGILQNVRMDSDKTSETLTEITTEITTVNNNNNDNDNAHKPVESAFKFFEQNGFGILTPHVADKMGAWIDDTNEGLVIYALQIAVENSALRWNYAESILRDWSNKKYTNVDQVMAAESKRTTGRERNGRNERSGKPTQHPNGDYDGIDF